MRVRRSTSSRTSPSAALVGGRTDGRRAGGRVLAPVRRRCIRRPTRRIRRRVAAPARRRAGRRGRLMSARATAGAALGALPASPYKGLAPFEDSALDELLFFGRERDRTVIAANLV